ncbi:MAG: hypothetical protein GC157_16445 [Frankiales bacterium]|nr:hypothetical protein [Frankiales bacterium]
MTDADTGTEGRDWRELVAVVLLSITTILTAWAGFQSSKWGGAMSISFSQASSARIQAARLDGDANRRITVQVSLYTQWLQAKAQGDETLAAYLAERFPEPLKTAFGAWRATDPQNNAQAPASPFDMPQYVVPESTQAKASDALADAKFQQALDYNQRGDNYTLLTVAFASVLFFAAISGRMRTRGAQWALLGLGLALFVVAVVLVGLYPKLV